MTDVRSLEHPTLKVPYETLNKRFRTAQKVIERELSHANGALDAAEKSLKGNDGADSYLALIDNVLGKVDNFKNKAGEVISLEEACASNIQTRLEHLRGGCTAQQSQGGSAPEPVTPQLAQWRQTRVDRMMVEHFLRSGFYNSAVRLAEAAGLTELTNIGLFMTAKEVEEALANRDTSKCLSWCHDNKSKMRKMRSSLEFNVRLQEYVELVKQGKKMEAVKHARKYLSSTDNPDNLMTVQRAMALLAFAPRINSVPHPAYREFFSEERWQGLIEQFRAENYRLFQLSNQSVFSVALQTGLSTLKTQRCSSIHHDANGEVSSIDAKNDGVRNRHVECPVCQEPLFKLAEHLPYAHCSQSRLICYMSGHPMNEHNHPLVLPNGFVYGEEALMKMAAENEGQIVCPRSKEIFTLDQAEKVFVL